MKAWLGTATPGQKGQTRGPVLVLETDVRDDPKDTVRCFFTDLLATERGQGEGSTLQGILGEGTST